MAISKKIKLKDGELAVMEIFWSSNKALCVEEITEILNERGRANKQAFVYRAVQMLSEMGFIKKTFPPENGNPTMQYFRAAVEYEEYMAHLFRQMRSTAPSLSLGRVFSAFLKISKENTDEYDEKEFEEILKNNAYGEDD